MFRSITPIIKVHTHNNIFPKFFRDLIYEYYFLRTSQRLSNSVQFLPILASNTIPHIQTLHCSKYFRRKPRACIQSFIYHVVY